MEAHLIRNDGELDEQKQVSKKLNTEGTFGGLDNGAAMRALRQAD